MTSVKVLGGLALLVALVLVIAKSMNISADDVKAYFSNTTDLLNAKQIDDLNGDEMYGLVKNHMETFKEFIPSNMTNGKSNDLKMYVKTHMDNLKVFFVGKKDKMTTETNSETSFMDKLKTLFTDNIKRVKSLFVPPIHENNNNKNGDENYGENDDGNYGGNDNENDTVNNNGNLISDDEIKMDTSTSFESVTSSDHITSLQSKNNDYQYSFMDNDVYVDDKLDIDDEIDIDDEMQNDDQTENAKKESFQETLESIQQQMDELFVLLKQIKDDKTSETPSSKQSKQVDTTIIDQEAEWKIFEENLKSLLISDEDLIKAVGYLY